MSESELRASERKKLRWSRIRVVRYCLYAMKIELADMREISVREWSETRNLISCSDLSRPTNEQ